MSVYANAKALRRGRSSELGRVYAITVVCYRRRPVFAQFQSARVVVSVMQELASQVSTLCYVVMPDHVHWLMQLELNKPIETYVQRLKSCVTRKIHERELYGGAVWARGFHDRAIRRESEILPIARYIVMNPLRAGIVGRLGDYPHWDAVWL